MENNGRISIATRTMVGVVRLKLIGMPSLRQNTMPHRSRQAADRMEDLAVEAQAAQAAQAQEGLAVEALAQ